VEFYSKNKFEKLVHLVGFIIRTCMVPQNITRTSAGYERVSEGGATTRRAMCL
jgi:hypothetical protein